MRSPTTPSNGALTSASPRFLWAISSWASATDTIEALFSAVGAGGIERRLRDDVALGERLLVAEVARRPARVGAGGVERRLPLVDPGLQLVGLEARQQLALGDAVAFAHQHLGQAAGDARLHDRLVDRLGGAGEAHDVDQAARLDGVQLGRDQLDRPLARLRRRGDGGGVAGTLAALPGEGAARQHDGGGDDDEQQLALGGHGRSPFRTKSM